jgi:hypothetical protein
MTTLIAFSGQPGDCIYVEEDLETVKNGLARGASGFSELTQVPAQSDAFDKGSALINAERIAFIREA